MHHLASPPLRERSPADAGRSDAVEVPTDGAAVSVLVCDPRTLTRECLAHGLAQQWPGAKVLQIADVRRLAELGDVAQDCHLAIVNLGARSMPAPDLSEALDVLESECQAPIVIISDDESSASAAEAMRRGVRAYVGTMCSLPVLIGILHLVRLGGTYVPSSWLTAEPTRPPAPPAEDMTISRDPVVQTFTPREIEILRGLKDGKPNKIIAHELSISESTAKVHIRHIMSKLSVTNRTQAALLACQLLSGAD